MKRHVDDTLRRLAAVSFPADIPARPRRPPWEHEPETAERPRFSRRRVLVAAGLTIVAISGSVVAMNQLDPGQPIPTPAPLTIQPAAGDSPFTVLTELADRAGKQAVPGGTGAVFYSALRDWSFGAVGTTSGRFVGTEVAEYRQELWLHPDGTGRTLRVEQNLDPSGNENPMVFDTPLRPQPSTVLAGAGHTTSTMLESQLREENKGKTAVDWFEIAAKVWTIRLGDPAATSAIERILASLPAVTVDGFTTDRTGRRAIAISTAAEDPGGWFPKQRRYLLFDPETGFPLAAEWVGLTADADAIGGPVNTPATIYYKVWLQSAFVPDTLTRP